MDNQEQIKKIDELIGKLDSKDFNLYFFVLDTKGNPVAGVANIYEHVKVLNELGYKAHILHEKNDYEIKGNELSTGIEDWMGEEYANLSHISIQDQKLNVSPEDFIFIPEIFSNMMDQIKNFPCKKVVFAQSPAYMFELLPIGKRWNRDFGFNELITTSETQAEYISNHFPQMTSHVVPVSIPSYFKPSNKPQKPIISILTRDNSDTIKIAKSFYLQYPMYKWVTFKDMRGMSRTEFARTLKESCLAVWVDDRAGFGTFPVEAMECGVPVIAKIPDMIPEWMVTKNEEGKDVIKDNGVWTNTTQNIPELIATFMKLYLEDNIPSELTDSMKSSVGKYTPENHKTIIEKVYGDLVGNRKVEFEGMKPKMEETKKD